ncbi:MAG: hypothetical protein RI947_1025 [Candidatus Parcubacteria bacterium]|jgi:hypothetical protein
MDKVHDTYGEFWNYLSKTQQDLILEGNYLMNDVIKHQNYAFHDYSFLIFPFAKAYEGYLKKLFLDVGFINHLDYVSDHLRLGKLMSPHLISTLGDRSLYKQLWTYGSKELADKVWETWKLGRNQIFHYFPHNVKAVTFEGAEQIINQLIQTMKEVHEKLNVQSLKDVKKEE